MYRYLCMYVCMYVRTYVCMYVCMYVMYVCMCIYIYIERERDRDYHHAARVRCCEVMVASRWAQRQRRDIQRGASIINYDNK